MIYCLRFSLMAMVALVFFAGGACAETTGALDAVSSASSVAVSDAATSGASEAAATSTTAAAPDHPTSETVAEQAPTTSTVVSETATSGPVDTSSTSTTVLPDLSTTEPDLGHSSRPSWQERLRATAVADNYREVRKSSPRIYKEIEAGKPLKWYAERQGAKAGKGFVPTESMLEGPISRQPEGTLSGRIIYCGGGHGFTYDASTGNWYTQRPITFGMVEDFGNLDQFNIFADYCLRAGATVVPMRPLGFQPIERIVDNADANAQFHGPWYDSESTIAYGLRKGRPEAPYRFAIAGTTESAVVRFRPYIPESGYYPIYCWARHGADRVTQTYRIVHGGQAAEMHVNHRRVGNGWVYLGEYYLDAGWDNYVEVTNKVSDPKDADGQHVVIADAIRFGNGLGSTDRGGGISDGGRDEEASRYWAETSLAETVPPIYDARDDDQGSNVGTPPRLAAHMNRETEGSYWDRIFLSFHSNASGGRGIVGLFEQSPELRPDGQVDWAEIIARLTNEEMLTSGVLEAPSLWSVRKKLTDSHIDFGEIRRDYLNNEMVATISEVAFHDEKHDAALLETPAFRDAAARASYKAVIKFLASHDLEHQLKVVFVPAAPRILSAIADGAESVRVQWAPPMPESFYGVAAYYRVSHSFDGYSFDGGTTTAATSYQYAKLSPGVPHYFRVQAINEGGESPATRPLGVMHAGAKQAVLLVSAFSSCNEDSVLTETTRRALGSGAAKGGDFVRLIPRLMNPGNQTVLTGECVAKAGLGYDSCSLEGITSSGLSLRDYALVGVLSGLQPAKESLLGADVVTTLSAFVQSGGALLASGSNLLEALKFCQDAKLKRNAQKLLGATFAANAPCTATLVGEHDEFLSTSTISLAQLEPWFTVNISGDVLKPYGDSVPLLRYSSPQNGIAGVYMQAGNGGQVVTFGFPFEMIRPANVRQEIMSIVLRRLIPDSFPPQPLKKNGKRARQARGSNR